MFKLRVVYISLLVVLGVLVLFTIVKPTGTGSKYSEIQRESLLKSDNGWVIQFDIMNHEGGEQNYTVHFVINDDKPYVEEIQLQNKMSFTFIRRIQKNEVEGKSANATFSVYKAGVANPIEHITYNLE
jgi:hypothetical protein